jgi:hypothetical protein
MVLLAEQERLIAQELNLINDSTQYSLTTGITWTTMKDWGNITLPNAGLLIINFAIAINNASGGSGGIRIKVGSYYACTSFSASTSFQNFGTAIWLAAGTYDVHAEGYLENNGSTSALYLQNFQCGLSAFNDTTGSALGTYSSGISLTVNNRTTPVGALQQATYFVQVYAVTSGANTLLNNIGQSQTNGVSIYVDGTQVNWGEIDAEEDYGGIGGKIAIPANVGYSHAITISKQNSSTAVTISVIASPWILSQVGYPGIPVNIYFSQGSTLYCMLEPWFLNPSNKFAGVGAIHGVTFGSTDDFYSSITGADLQEFSYMMDIVDILNNNLMTEGLGGCIGVVAVDAR